MDEIMENCDPLSQVKHTPIFDQLGHKKSYYKNKKFIEYIIIEHNDKQKLVEKKLSELAKNLSKHKHFVKEYRPQSINYITYLLVFYTNAELLDLWYYYIPDAFQIFFEIENYINITYISKNIKNLYYLIDRQGGSLWKTINKKHNLNTLVNYDVETFKKIILRDKFIDYSISTNDIIELCLKIKNIDVINILCEQYKIYNEEISLKEEFLKVALINNHKGIIKNFFEKELETYPINIIDYVLYPKFEEIDQMYEFAHPPSHSLFYNKFYSAKQLSDNLDYVYHKLSSQYGKQPVLDYILNTYNDELQGNLITSVIRFHCKFIIKDIKEIKGTDYLRSMLSGWDNSILCDLMRYGQYEVLEYIFDNNEDLFTNCCYKNVLVDFACYNSDDRVLKFILKKIGNNYQYNNNILNFLNITKISDKKKIQKLKIICNNFELTSEEKDNIIGTTESKDPSFKLFFWQIAKFYNNVITNDIPHLENFLRVIMLSKNQNILDKFINLCSLNFNYWEIFNLVIYYYYELNEPEKIINKIVFKLDDIKKYPRYETKILNSLECSHYDLGYNTPGEKLKGHKIKNFDKLLKMLKKSGFNLNKKCFSYQKSNILCKIYHPELFKVAIMNGVSFPDFFKDSINSWGFFSPNSMITKYRSLYKLIKRIQIRREIKNRKLHRQNFYDTKVCINHRPPSDNIPVLKKGGEEFYKIHRSMISDMSWEEDFVNPKHIEPLELLEISKNEILVTPKIDGVTAKNMDMDNIYPHVPEQFQDCIFDGEYIKELDIYLVFGIRNAENNLNCPYDDFIELRNEHPFTKFLDNNFIITNSDFTNLNLKITNEFKAIQNYIEHNKGKTLWWPKAFWRIFDTDIILDVLETLQKVQSNTLNSEIKTDGLIINIPFNKKDVYKLKPTEHMTIDLKYNGKWRDAQQNYYDIVFSDKIIGEDNIKHGTYRCYFENGKWEAQEYRPEKKHPNPKNIVDAVQEYHNNPWTIKELKKYQSPVYYQHFDANPNLKVFTQQKNNWFRHNINDGMKILDIGCGYLNGLIWNNPHHEIDGLDNDISVNKRFTELSKKKNKKVFIQDFTEKWNFQNDYIKRKFNDGVCNKLYDVILMNFSIHYSFNKKNGFDNLMTEINKRSVSGNTMLMISFIDLDVLFKDRDQIDFEDGGFFKNTGDILYGDIGAMTYYYPWRSNKINNEKIIGYCDIKYRLSNYGWYEQRKITTDYEVSTMGYKELNKAIKRVTFMKK
jgi:hypothetical protein